MKKPQFTPELFEKINALMLDAIEHNTTSRSSYAVITFASDKPAVIDGVENVLKYISYMHTNLKATGLYAGATRDDSKRVYVDLKPAKANV
jgi:hypothetical protein